MKKILITGKDSYIGTSVEKLLQQFSEAYVVHTLDVRDDTWKTHDFSNYDSVFHVAGIAHVSSDPKMEQLYYKVNRDLTIDVANTAKKSGVKQFIFMSSIIVYGRPQNGKITQATIPNPLDFYGQSKLEAEKGIFQLQDDDFNVVVLRPPMIYGPNSKGNYPKLVKLAKKTPIFPDFPNKRSMLHIDNLCQFVKQRIDLQDNGTYFPQNPEYVNTSNLVKEIAREHGRKIWMTKIFNPFIRMFLSINIVNKVFGNLYYDDL